ncbi:unnamed protein product [Amoebophrya sp. A25]|nr:unnamed protein product [Amoebophrya sp. A25]|eukprot:GSA25T00016844001.1
MKTIRWSKNDRNARLTAYFGGSTSSSSLPSSDRERTSTSSLLSSSNTNTSRDESSSKSESSKISSNRETNSGKGFSLLPWPPELLQIKKRVEEWYKVKTGILLRFTVCVCNLYRDGSEHIGWHTDKEEILWAAEPSCKMEGLPRPPDASLDDTETTSRSHTTAFPTSTSNSSTASPPQTSTLLSPRTSSPPLAPPIASISLGASRDFLLRSVTQREDRLHLRLHSGSLLLMQNACQHQYVHCVPREKGCKSPRLNLTFRCVPDWYLDQRRKSYF